MNRFVLAGALGSIDFDLLTSDNIRNCRGYWGETLEIKFPKGVIFIYIDENNEGFLKTYKTENFEKVKDISVTEDTLENIMKEVIEEGKTVFV